MKYNIKIIENVLSEYEKNKNISHISKIFDIPSGEGTQMQMRQFGVNY